MNYHQFDNDYRNQSNSSTSSGLSLSKYTAQTFAWMCLGLMITFLTAFGLAVTGVSVMLLSIPFMSIILCVVQVVVVLTLSTRIQKISPASAIVLFLTYSFFTGITFSSLFYAYGFGQVVSVFLLISLYFGALAAFGFFTKVDLSKLGPLFMVGIVFLIVSGVFLLFVNIPFMETAMCLVGIVIFLGLTAYDTQKIHQQYYMFQHDSQVLAKASVISALQLYMDFINLFLYLLRFLGSSRD